MPRILLIWVLGLTAHPQPSRGSARPAREGAESNFPMMSLAPAALSPSRLSPLAVNVSGYLHCPQSSPYSPVLCLPSCKGLPAEPTRTVWSLLPTAPAASCYCRPPIPLPFWIVPTCCRAIGQAVPFAEVPTPPLTPAPLLLA